ncbi:helix-turn-helix domain-containing protein [Streptomyces sp. NPDC055893]
MSSRFLGIAEAADFLGMSQRWMYRDSRRHGLPRYYFGGRLKFKVEDLERWTQQQKVS